MPKTIVKRTELCALEGKTYAAFYRNDNKPARRYYIKSDRQGDRLEEALNTRLYPWGTKLMKQESIWLYDTGIIITFRRVSNDC